MCREAAESSNHIFLHCPIAASLWVYVLVRFKAEWIIPGLVKSLLEAWPFQSFLNLNHISLEVWRLLPFAIYWTVWKSAKRIFEGRAAPFHKMVRSVLLKLFEWLLDGLPGFNIQDSSCFLVLAPCLEHLSCAQAGGCIFFPCSSNKVPYLKKKKKGIFLVLC